MYSRRFSFFVGLRVSSVTSVDMASGRRGELMVVRWEEGMEGVKAWVPVETRAAMAITEDVLNFIFLVILCRVSLVLKVSCSYLERVIGGEMLRIQYVLQSEINLAKE